MFSTQFHKIQPKIKRKFAHLKFVFPRHHGRYCRLRPPCATFPIHTLISHIRQWTIWSGGDSSDAASARTLLTSKQISRLGNATDGDSTGQGVRRRLEGGEHGPHWYFRHAKINPFDRETRRVHFRCVPLTNQVGSRAETRLGQGRVGESVHVSRSGGAGPSPGRSSIRLRAQCTAWCGSAQASVMRSPPGQVRFPDGTSSFSDRSLLKVFGNRKSSGYLRVRAPSMIKNRARIG